jgi:hypothetical protein
VAGGQRATEVGESPDLRKAQAVTPCTDAVRFVKFGLLPRAARTTT